MRFKIKSIMKYVLKIHVDDLNFNYRIKFNLY